MGGRGLESEGRRKDGREIAFGCRMIMAQDNPRRRDCSEREDELRNRIDAGGYGSSLKRPLVGLLSHFLALGIRATSQLLDSPNHSTKRFNNVAH